MIKKGFTTLSLPVTVSSWLISHKFVGIQRIETIRSNELNSFGNIPVHDAIEIPLFLPPKRKNHALTASTLCGSCHWFISYWKPNQSTPNTHIPYLKGPTKRQTKKQAKRQAKGQAKKQTTKQKNKKKKKKTKTKTKNKNNKEKTKLTRPTNKWTITQRNTNKITD